MALRREKLFALKYGEGAQKPSATYTGGMPVTVTATGYDKPAAATLINGISANSAAYDLQYNGKVTYDSTVAWVVGDKIYWNVAKGLWDRTPETAHDPAYGIVLEVGASASYLVVQFERLNDYNA